MSDPLPRVSVALCTYNGAVYLESQLESLAAQSTLPFEVVIGDDHSSDATAEIVARFAARAPFPVRFEVNPAQLGPTGNFSAAFSRCQGDVVAFCDQDDLWRSDKVAQLTEVFAARSAPACCISDARLIDRAGEDLGHTLWDLLGFGLAEREAFRAGHHEPYLLRRTIAFGLTMAFRADLREHLLPVPMPWGHDNWSALVCEGLGEVVLIDEPLVDYRQHAGQFSSAGRRGVERLLTALRDTESRNSSITPTAESYYQLDARLAALAEVTDYPERLERLRHEVKRKARHMEVRGSLSPYLPGRVSTVVSELIQRRYHAYSNGSLSALRDLWKGPR